MTWVIVPAAGVGSRMQSKEPKQYLKIAGQTLISYTLDVLQKVPQIKAIVVVLHPEDSMFRTLDVNEKVITVIGGAERQDSVSAGLAYLKERANANDWVLVHDAARPCITPEEISQFIAQIEQGNADGGLLALPVRDTVKKADDLMVLQTVERENLYLAQTPQMFKLGALNDALQDAEHVTDEASALEQQGASVQIIKGSVHNVKVTYPEDLGLVEMILKLQGRID